SRHATYVCAAELHRDPRTNDESCTPRTPLPRTAHPRRERMSRKGRSSPRIEFRKAVGGALLSIVSHASNAGAARQCLLATLCAAENGSAAGAQGDRRASG